MINKTNIIGLMSGSSLDGIDLVDVDFWHDGKWHFEIVAKDNYDYNDDWKTRGIEQNLLKCVYKENRVTREIILFSRKCV